MIPVEGHKNLFRDENTGAILNCDSNSYNNYIFDKMKNSDRKIEMENMKKEIEELKFMLKELSSKIT